MSKKKSKGAQTSEGDEIQSWQCGDLGIPRVKLVIAVLLCLRDVKNLVHIRLPLFCVEFKEDNHGNCKQSGVERKERKFRHLWKLELILKDDGITKFNYITGEGRDGFSSRAAVLLDLLQRK